MKNFNKILILMVVISVITSVFVFSVSADDTLPNWNGKDLTGTTWTLPTGWVVSAYMGEFNINCVANYTADDNTEKNIQCSLIKMGYWGNSSGANKITFYGFNNGSNSALNHTVSNNKDVFITFTDGDDVTNTSFISWLFDYGELTSHSYNPVCDGSTCPATDVNLDNVCDDCGMTFSMPREFTPSDFPSGYPSVPSVASDARYYLYRVQSSGSTYIVVYPSTVTPTYDTTKQNGYLTFSESYGSYRLLDNEWVLNNDDSPYSIGGTNNNSVDVLFSSVTIKDENGENFFPIPLWEKVEKVTQGEIPQFNLTVGGNLMTLTLCGVGCLTLLMALVLLSKTFRTYLPR